VTYKAIDKQSINSHIDQYVRIPIANTYA